jgi:hypothetical protein
MMPKGEALLENGHSEGSHIFSCEADDIFTNTEI